MVTEILHGAGLGRGRRTAPAEPGAAPGQRTPSIASAVARFMVLSLIGVVLLGAVSVVLIERLGSEEAVRSATQSAALVGRNAVAPLLTPELMDGDPAALAALHEVVESQVLDGQVVRVKLWREDGRIIYADEERLIGRTFPLEGEERAALMSGEAYGSLSDADRDENAFEQGRGPLLQVYVPLETLEGERVLFEMYQRSTSVLTDSTRLSTAFLPIALGAVFLLWATQGPLAYAMARKLRAGHRERERLLAAAADAGRLERRRVAADLHDGTIQHLAGVAYELDAAADDAERAPGAQSDALREAAENLRHAIRQLRSLVMEITPPALRQEGLGAALSDVVGPLSMRGIEVELTVPADFRAGRDAEAILLRAAQEAVRNIVRHAEASRAGIAVSRDGDRAVLVVADDGRGFGEQDLLDAREEGHMGLRLLEDLVGESGGTMQITTAGGAGTTLRVEVPA